MQCDAIFWHPAGRFLCGEQIDLNLTDWGFLYRAES